MCENCDGKLLFAVGELKGIITGIKDKQEEIHLTVTENRVASEESFKDLSSDITNLKIRVIGIGAIFGSIFGFLSQYIPKF